MALCFICNSKLYSERTRVCSSITPHTNTSYPEKISEMLGEEFVVIVTPSDQMCMKCSSLLNHLDKCDNDSKLIKTAMVSFIQRKYGILPPDQAVKGVEIVNGHLVTEEQQEQGQSKVPIGLTVGVSPTASTAAIEVSPTASTAAVEDSPTASTTAVEVSPISSTTAVGVSSTASTAATVTPIQTSLKLSKTQQQQQQKQRQPQQQQQSTNKIRIYKCGFCAFQSKELGHVRFHMRTHTIKKDAEKPILNQTAAKTLTQIPVQKRRLYRCQVCSKTFESRINCVDHIQKDHNQPTPSTSNEARETRDFDPVTKTEPSNIQENNQQAETHLNVDENQQFNNKVTVDSGMMLNDNVPTEGYADVGKETENFFEGTTTKESGREDDGDKAILEQEADQKISDHIKKEVSEDNANEENKRGGLDIDSMLATIHNDNYPTNRDTKGNA